ncbi:metalloregulator ArsR/SmtB family transcription factor [Rhodobacter sp. KR11]|uniref:metalloregulator ArsR/SmtB family transcription factor n=1 Tax=Rhodobacter sp. KR11 TaxID=2974588 RepID=UPI0022223E45|nr:metalloregulator ArsR/SmtB family transcription factor [Rhodobacter sp. KR11]MCW1919919.1 metalloregulator ArsR/SmtB family transcription factor [Rhodobacter sp. KR11]
MEMNQAAQSFTALGHPGRLAVFRILMRRAPGPARPSEIAEALGMKANTLSHHLADLQAAGLIGVTREGRSLLYAVDLARAGALVGYLAEDCCRGRADICAEIKTMTTPYDVLFLCSGNSARSIFAEALLRDLGGAKFRAHSAGTRPGSQLNPFALDVLVRNGHDLAGLQSKHVADLQGQKMDFVFTVCDQAALEECPPWPGQPVTAHWGLPDPVKATGTDAEKGLVFAQTYGALRRRIQAFAALPFDQLDRLALQTRLDALSKE